MPGENSQRRHICRDCKDILSSEVKEREFSLPELQHFAKACSLCELLLDGLNFKTGVRFQIKREGSFLKIRTEEIYATTVKPGYNDGWI